MRTIPTLDDLSRICQPLPAVVPLQDLPSIPNVEIREGRYLARFAQTVPEIDAALQLRFEVFNLELGEGLASSYVKKEWLGPTGSRQGKRHRPGQDSTQAGSLIFLCCRRAFWKTR